MSQEMPTQAQMVAAMEHLHQQIETMKQSPAPVQKKLTQKDLNAFFPFEVPKSLEAWRRGQPSCGCGSLWQRVSTPCRPGPPSTR